MTDLRTPINGQPVVQEGIYTTRPVAGDASKAMSIVDAPAVLQDISALAGAFARLNAGGFNVRKLLPPSLQTTPPPDKDGGKTLAHLAMDGLRSLADLYADAQVREEDLPALQMARGRLEQVLAMEPALKMLSKPVRLRLRERLFDPLRVLVDTAQEHAAMVMRKVERRDRVALQHRLSNLEGTYYTSLYTSRFSRRSDFNGAHRYSVGDPIQIGLEDGGTAFGYVTHRCEGGVLIAEWLDPHGDIQLAELSPEKTVKDNPLKIGDCFQAFGHIFYVAVDGMPFVRRRSDQRALHVFDELGEQHDPQVLLDRLTPLERLASLSTIDSLYADDADRSTIPTNRGSVGEVALHADRGPGSEEGSEDAVCALMDRWGRIYVGVFDQALRKSSDPETHGAASKIARETFSENMRELAVRHAPIEDSAESMKAAISFAHRAISARSKGEVTTFVGAMIDGSRAIILNVGHSGVIHCDCTGRVIEKTREQGASIFVPEALGTTGRDPAPDTYRWNVSEGDYLVFGSNGLFECGLTPKEIAIIVGRTVFAEDATRVLREEVAKRMKDDRSQRSNLAIAVVYVRPVER